MNTFAWLLLFVNTTKAYEYIYCKGEQGTVQVYGVSAVAKCSDFCAVDKFSKFFFELSVYAYPVPFLWRLFMDVLHTSIYCTVHSFRTRPMSFWGLGSARYKMYRNPRVWYLVILFFRTAVSAKTVPSLSTVLYNRQTKSPK